MSILKGNCNIPNIFPMRTKLEKSDTVTAVLTCTSAARTQKCLEMGPNMLVCFNFARHNLKKKKSHSS